VDPRLILTVAASLLVAWAAFIGLLWLLKPSDTRLRDLVRVVPDVLRLVRDLIRDARAPIGPRIAAATLVLWLLNPVDLVPEFIPVLGPLDDVVVAVLVLRYVARRIGRNELRHRWPGTDDGYALLSRVL
jgi:uncharacterized membrane protein YkvA (DUF1232 family)